ncbi:hypothetical protein AB0M22_31600 [Nocardia sp. NPDC051756]|uniref:hypothetical protein n=1 Tax=Nocardia sp. NPDC051756 TaxID=3154751 RepID=UPI0034188839
MALVVVGSLCGAGPVGADVGQSPESPQAQEIPHVEGSSQTRVSAPEPGAAPAYTQDGVDWYPAQCAARWYGSELKAGWMDWCYQWGEAKYPGQGAHFFVIKHYATCGNDRSDFMVIKCRIGMGNFRPSAFWQDWSPRGDITASACPSSVSLSVAVGPVSVGGSFNACEKLKMAKSNPAVGYSLTWEGAVHRGDFREVSYMISLGSQAAGMGMDVDKYIYEIVDR